MTGTASLRKSSRLTKSKSDVGSNAQSRITEFVNVKKRANGNEAIKKVGEIDLNAAEVREVKEVILTPVKNKRRAINNAVVEEVKKSGVLTPSPSLESVTEAKSENAVIKSPLVSVTKTEVIETELNTAKATPSVSAVPAYKRFAHLVEGVRNQKPKLDTTVTSEIDKAEKIVIFDTPVTSVSAENTAFNVAGHKFVPWLPLNEKWSMYEKIIFNVDNLCVLAAGRSQPCVFHKIQKTLEGVLGKQVPIEQMERLKTLWPEAYEFRESRVVIQGKRVESVALTVPGIGGTDSSAALMSERKEEVRGRVQKYLINAHMDLFSDLKNEEVPKEWHSKFDQNKVAELPRTTLIETGSAVPQRCSTPKLINDIIAQSPSRQVSIGTTDGTVASTPTQTPTTVQPAEKKLSLLERIREKEQKLQAQKCFGGDPETARLSAILSQMDRFTQSVMFTFSSAKKTSLFLTDLTQKLIQSSGTALSVAEVVERLKLLEKAAPDWIKIVEEGVAPKHVKILDKSRSLNSILDSLKALKRE